MFYKRLIGNIMCRYKEFRLVNGKWTQYLEDRYYTTNRLIINMVQSSSYFSKLGGYMSVDYDSNRRFGLTPVKVVCVSICKTIKKVYCFNYNDAQVLA